MTLRQSIRAIDWQDKTTAINEFGYCVLNGLLNAEHCTSLRSLYDSTQLFRSHIKMSRYNFGKGEYKYFDYPLPDVVRQLRTMLYAPLAEIANHWALQLKDQQEWPTSVDEMLNRCHSVEQNRPTPLLLRYQNGDYNCLHQDIYGEVYFPLQAICLLSRPTVDFCGGELTLVEQRPRMQSRPIIVPLKQGDVAIIPVRERPCANKQGRYFRAKMRHGVGEVSFGTRYALGIIFHDAK